MIGEAAIIVKSPPLWERSTLRPLSPCENLVRFTSAQTGNLGSIPCLVSNNISSDLTVVAYFFFITINIVMIYDFQKKIRNMPFVSLGSGCQVPHNLIQLGLYGPLAWKHGEIRPSMPFDWTWACSFSTLVDILKNDFFDYLDEENFERKSNEVSDDYGANKKYLIEFPHHSIADFKSFYDNFNKKVLRFREAISDGSVVFVRQEEAVPDAKLALDLHEYYEKKGIQSCFILIRSQPEFSVYSCNDFIMECGFPMYDRSKGVDFWMGYENFWRRAILGIRGIKNL